MGELLLTEPLVDTVGVNSRPSSALSYSDDYLAATDFLSINVGGKSYRIRHKTVQMRETRLALLGQLSLVNHQRRLVIADGFFPESGEYYFERTSKAFDPIIDFYMTGNLHRPSDMCPDRFREELLYWGLLQDEVAPCCAPSMIVVNGDSVVCTVDNDKKDKTPVDFKGLCFASVRRRLWPILEDPRSSHYAKVFAVLSVIFVFASVFGEFFYLLLTVIKVFRSTAPGVQSQIEKDVPLALDEDDFR